MVHPALAAPFRPPLLAASSRRLAKHTSRSSSLLSSHVPLTWAPSFPSDTLKDARIDALQDSLFREGNSSRVWAHYTNILNYFSYDVLPLEIHQQVLRQCCPPSPLLRFPATRRLMQGRKPEHPHLYEGRFQTVISNIRALGFTPSLHDYHFVLEQFAAVGHHTGSLQVYKELVHLGLTPEHKTFGLCLQAIAHRLTLPILKVYRPRLIAQTRKTLEDLMSDMRKFQVSFTSANLDLTIRIFKETTDREGFDALVKWAYGIDLANPDCPPLGYLDTPASLNPSCAQPFSSHALNTIIDTLGRFGDVSKLIQAFEVLTQPLPRASQHIFTSFDDDDDFGVPTDVSTTPSFIPPHAPPNTTTYNMLLRHIGQAGHAVLARHYLLQAISLDRKTGSELRMQIRRTRQLEEIKAPHFSLNRRMLLSVFGQTNRRKNLGLMRWLSTKIPRILRDKRRDLEFYTNLRDRRRPLPKSSSINVEPEARVTSLSSSLRSRKLGALLSHLPRHSLPSNIAVDVRKLGTAFEVDVNDQSLPKLPPEKMFNIDLHIDILSRDVSEIASFTQALDKVLGRTHQRVKERLGRRVWASKNIYLSTEGQRIAITRDRWREIVHFKPRRDLAAQAQRIRNHDPHLLQRPYSTDRVLEQPPASVVNELQT